MTGASGSSSVATEQTAINHLSPVRPNGPTNRLSEYPAAISESTGPTTSRLTLKVSESMHERMSAFALVHRMYQRAGLTSENPLKMRVLKHHVLDTTDVMVAKRNDSVEFTSTLVRDGVHGMPSESLFADEIRAMRLSGLRLAEVSSLASGCELGDKKQRVETLISMISLTIHVARRRGVDRLILAVHPRHAKVYQRMFGCAPCSDVRQYEAVRGNPAVLCMHDFRELDVRKYSLYNRVYGEQYSPWAMDGTRMSDAEKRFFSQAISVNQSECMPMAA
ncbi:hypothetical protein FYK55_05045 [Roseiconus nitratireducens]|uniref:N-acyl amino acid synthase FeeM catalytic core domain-containing protein n=1 Tax=Roseiconus nitratireducens TaxID=2605748 RepID=A0A5M6DLM2_9BACT|nr:hypothetical protein [Roseiconus nitratireducens]KAA5546255.1 hypothetical protein FYK55_05045 [Roseiconus nitratireducens]